jgi:hypothetical protein
MPGNKMSDERGIIIVGLPDNSGYRELINMIAATEIGLVVIDLPGDSSATDSLLDLAGTVSKLEVKALEPKHPQNDFIEKKMKRFRPRWQR